jgi:hypothetical protein
LTAGFNAYVAKPYMPDVLVDVIGTLTPLVEAQRALRAIYQAQRGEQRALRERVARRQEQLREESECLNAKFGGRILRDPDTTGEE